MIPDADDPESWFTDHMYGGYSEDDLVALLPEYARRVRLRENQAVIFPIETAITVGKNRVVNAMIDYPEVSLVPPSLIVTAYVKGKSWTNRNWPCSFSPSTPRNHAVTLEKKTKTNTRRSSSRPRQIACGPITDDTVIKYLQRAHADSIPLVMQFTDGKVKHRGHVITALYAMSQDNGSGSERDIPVRKITDALFRLDTSALYLDRLNYGMTLATRLAGRRMEEDALQVLRSVPEREQYAYTRVQSSHGYDLEYYAELYNLGRIKNWIRYVKLQAGVGKTKKHKTIPPPGLSNPPGLLKSIPPPLGLSNPLGLSKPPGLLKSTPPLPGLSNPPSRSKPPGLSRTSPPPHPSQTNDRREEDEDEIGFSIDVRGDRISTAFDPINLETVPVAAWLSHPGNYVIQSAPGDPEWAVALSSTTLAAVLNAVNSEGHAIIGCTTGKTAAGKTAKEKTGILPLVSSRTLERYVNLIRLGIPVNGVVLQSKLRTLSSKTPTVLFSTGSTLLGTYSRYAAVHPPFLQLDPEHIAWAPSSKEQHLALSNYSKHWDAAINQYLRTGPEYWQTPEFAKYFRRFGRSKRVAQENVVRMVGLIDAAFGEAMVTGEPITVWRGVNPPNNSTWDKKVSGNWDDVPEAELQSKLFAGVQSGFLSTTVSPEVAENFVTNASGCCYQEIHVPVGTPYIVMHEGISQYAIEQEILFPRGVELRIVGHAKPTATFELHVPASVRERMLYGSRNICRAYPVYS